MMRMMALFNVLEKGGEAKKHDVDFLHKISQSGTYLRDNQDVLEHAWLEADMIVYGYFSPPLSNIKVGGDNDENSGCVNAETGGAHGVEGCDSTQQSKVTPKGLKSQCTVRVVGRDKYSSTEKS